MGPRGGVVTRRSAKPFTPVRFWSWPPSIQSAAYAEYLTGAGPPGGLAYQQAAYQPSGNGTSGQASPLSLAALGGALKIGRPATMKSSPGTGATAVRTASSNRSNSASLIAHSHLRSAQRRKSPLFPD